MGNTEQLRTTLLNKLKELFQLDQPDLDFGFYRIMHARAKEVTEFIDHDLEINFEENDIERLTKYVLYIDKVIDLLSKEAKPFIINEYIKNYNNSSWWTKVYNRSTYYKIRKAALDEFLNYVE